MVAISRSSSNQSSPKGFESMDVESQHQALEQVALDEREPLTAAHPPLNKKVGGTGGATAATVSSEKRSACDDDSDDDLAKNPSQHEQQTSSTSGASSSELTSTGLKVLVLLALQNCTKNLLVRYVMRDAPKFLLSAAVIGSELTKLTLSTLYILLIDRRPLSSIVTFLREDVENTKLLLVPASVYNLQQTLEFIALSNIDASVFSVLVQSKLLMTAVFSTVLLRKRLRKAQVLSLILLTVGVVLCNMKDTDSSKREGLVDDEADGLSAAARRVKGTFATLGIALASGFAAVYTEKVIKARRSARVEKKNYSLAYMQVQLASVSLCVMGAWAVLRDFNKIVHGGGLFQNFTVPALVSVVNSGVGGLMVAAVLKYADSVLKGYATAMSVVLTGLLSAVLFGTSLSTLYGLGIVNVIVAVVLYNASDLDRYLC